MQTDFTISCMGIEQKSIQFLNTEHTNDNKIFYSKKKHYEQI